MSYQFSSQQPSTISALSIVGLVFGILAWIVLPVVGALVALVCGRLALREIRLANPGTIRGENMAKAAVVLAYVQLLGLLVAVVLLVLIHGIAP